MLVKFQLSGSNSFLDMKGVKTEPKIVGLYASIYGTLKTDKVIGRMLKSYISPIWGEFPVIPSLPNVGCRFPSPTRSMCSISSLFH